MKKELVAQQNPKSPISEIFRTLRTNIQFMNTTKKLQTILITSTFPGEGKSYVSSNLAVTFAQAGKKVILIDADMRKGRLYSIFDVSPKPGLSNYLSGIDLEEGEEQDIAEYIQTTDVSNLLLIPAGNVPPNPSELLISTKMSDLLEELKQVCDIIIVDGTPCELVTDSVILSRIVDSTVVVTAAKETKKENLSRVISSIKNVDGKLAGVVVNKIPISAKKYNEKYYYGYTAVNYMDTDKKIKNKETISRGKREKIKNRTSEVMLENKKSKSDDKAINVKEEKREITKIENKFSNLLEKPKALEHQNQEPSQEIEKNIFEQMKSYLEKEKNNLE